MSFDPKFRPRFDEVIAPAIRAVSIGDTQLEPHGVETSIISDSIIAEIIEGITNDTLVIVDITSIGQEGGRAVRNSNVMYELGLAHAIRRPEHVLILRSDEDPLLFDVSGIRVLSYDPEGRPDEARELVTTAIADSLTFSQRLDAWTVDHAAKSLDPLSLLLLVRIAGFPNVVPSFEDLKLVTRNIQLQPILHRLFDLDLIELEPLKATSAANPRAATIDELTNLRATRLGTEVVFLTFHRTGMFEAFASQRSDIARRYETWLRTHPDEAAGNNSGLPSSEYEP